MGAISFDDKPANAPTSAATAPIDTAANTATAKCFQWRFLVTVLSMR